MKWVRARLREPTTWSAFSSLALALGLYGSTRWPWWRDMVYLSAAFAVVAAIRAEGPR